MSSAARRLGEPASVLSDSLVARFQHGLGTFDILVDFGFITGLLIVCRLGLHPTSSKLFAAAITTGVLAVEIVNQIFESTG
ncbi:MAG: hypothetical protein R3E58_13075 [Phycisphaerae bacterium]